MIKFGTGGWRAIIGEDFSRDNLEKLAYAMCLKMKAEKVDKDGIVIGYDRRFLSKEAVMWMAHVFADEGIHVLFVDRSAPTPLIMWYVLAHNMHYGMMVTASHNPAIYNGVKIFTSGGRDANEEQTRDIEQYIAIVEKKWCKDRADRGKMPPDSYTKAFEKGAIETIHPLNEYLDSIIAKIDMDAIRQADLRIAVDPMHGVSLTSLSTVLSIARCEVETINFSHDTLFGGRMPAPSEKALRNLQTYVVDRRCDMGIATDGDGDRLGVIDDMGRYLHANDILVMLYYYLLKYKGWAGPAVRNISTTHRLDRVAEMFGQECYEVPVGFKWISSKMQETNALIGGESSGGLTVRGHINGKDGIYAAMLLVEMRALTGKKLSEIEDEIRGIFGTTYMVEHNCRFPVEEKERMQKMLLKNRQLPEFPFAVDHLSYLDGCKVYFKNGGWVVARFSGTEPLLRVFCEMTNKIDALKVCEAVENFMDIHPGIE